MGDTNLKIKSVQEVENGVELIKTEENTYSGIIPLEDINNGIKHKIRMEIMWEDNEENSGNDTEIGKNHQLQIPIIFHAIQYLGEEIIPVTSE